ncbi:hypothetical protein [Hyella patelloides]|nr:hypothetical protein [Hyella patelloides]
MLENSEIAVGEARCGQLSCCEADRRCNEMSNCLVYSLGSRENIKVSNIL